MILKKLKKFVMCLNLKIYSQDPPKAVSKG
jgi:hypothetical protein